VKELIGRNVFIRTVTLYYTGRLTSVEDGFARLDDAAWIADTGTQQGRFAKTLADGLASVAEVEPYPGECYVAMGAIVDVSQWLHDLPRKAQPR
jgi:hypothetical protein